MAKLPANCPNCTNFGLKLKNDRLMVKGKLVPVVRFSCLRCNWAKFGLVDLEQPSASPIIDATTVGKSI